MMTCDQQQLFYCGQGVFYSEPLYCAADKPPLYFQHEGHSRTIVGVEWLHNPGKDAGPSVHLLVLDPSQGTASLEKSLRSREGWQVCMHAAVCSGAAVAGAGLSVTRVA